MVLLIALVCAGIQALPESAQAWVRYERTGIENGQFWRLVSGHMAHLGWSHLAMNVVGLFLVTWLFATPGRTLEWAAANDYTIESYIEDRFFRGRVTGFGDLGFETEKGLGLFMFRDWVY